MEVMAPDNKIYGLKRVEFEDMCEMATASFMEEIAVLKVPPCRPPMP